MAVGIIGLFVLGLWMVDLDYYSPYYRSAPHMHRSIGMLLLIWLVVRFGWRLVNPSRTRGAVAVRALYGGAHRALGILPAAVWH